MIDPISSEHALWIGQPLDMGSDLRAEKAHTLHLALMLRDTTVPRRASAAAEYVHRLMDMTVARHVTEAAACTKGCHYCCASFVGVTIPEVLSLAAHVRSDAALAQKIIGAAEEMRAVPQQQRDLSGLFCAVLEAGLCGGYIARPIACRTMLSRSLSVCERFYVAGENIPITRVAGAAEVRGRVELVFQAALNLAQLPSQHVELTHALAIALTNDDAEAQWLAGVPVFADVAVDRHEGKNEDLNKWTQILADTVRPAL